MLVERLTCMTAATLRNKLEEESPELRRAAVLACAAKDDSAYVPDLMQRLDDTDEAVVRAAGKRRCADGQRVRHGGTVARLVAETGVGVIPVGNALRGVPLVTERHGGRSLQSTDQRNLTRAENQFAPIHFPCRRCRQPLSVRRRQADQPVLCPNCKGETLAPSASEPTRTLITAVPPRTAPIAPPPIAPPVPPHRLGMRTIAVAVAILIVAGSLTAAILVPRPQRVRAATCR